MIGRMKGTLLVILLVAQLISGNIPVSQLNALEDFYYATNGANWLGHSNWLVGDPCSNHWYGIACSSGQISSM